MSARRPTGFVILAVCAAVYGVLGLEVLDGEIGIDLPALGLGAVACTAALAFVTAEALFFARRWAFAATAAFATGYATMLLLIGSLAGDFGTGAMLAGGSGIFLLPALGYVSGRVEALYPPHRRTAVP